MTDDRERWHPIFRSLGDLLPPLGSGEYQPSPRTPLPPVRWREPNKSMMMERDVQRLRELIARWDAAKSGPDAFAIYHETIAYLLEGRSEEPCNWQPLRRMLDAIEPVSDLKPKGGCVMQLDEALRILALCHTRDDSLTGFVVEMTANDLFVTRHEYIEAWKVVREHLHLQTKGTADIP